MYTHLPQQTHNLFLRAGGCCGTVWKVAKGAAEGSSENCLSHSLKLLLDSDILAVHRRTPLNTTHNIFFFKRLDYPQPCNCKEIPFSCSVLGIHDNSLPKPQIYARVKRSRMIWMDEYSRGRTPWLCRYLPGVLGQTLGVWCSGNCGLAGRFQVPLPVGLGASFQRLSPTCSSCNCKEPSISES